MDVEDISYHEPSTASRCNHFLLPQRSIRGLIIGKSDCGKTTLLNNLLLRSGWLDYDRLYVFGKSLHQPIYQLLRRALGKGFSKEDIRDLIAVEDQFPISLVDVVDALPPPPKSNGIQPFFFEHGEDVPDPRELDPNRKNLMVFDDLMLSKQNTCEDYYVRGRHNNVDCFYLCQNYFRLPRQSIRENANFICLFRQDAKNLDHIRRDHCGDLTKEQFDALCQHSWANPYGFVTIDLTSSKANGKYRCKLDEFFRV